MRKEEKKGPNEGLYFPNINRRLDPAYLLGI